MKTIVTAATALKIKDAAIETIDIIQNVMANPIQFLTQGYWDLSHETTPKLDELLDDLSDEETDILSEWIASWLATLGWKKDVNDHIRPIE